MTMNDMPQNGLIYNGTEIRAVAERLNLTDMWKAAGSDPQQKPAKWRDLPSTKEFVDHVGLIVGKSDTELFHVAMGGKSPRTEAHWQIGLAYAKYLSPEFHMWCNTVVRERMEGRPAHTDADDLTRRIDGVARSTIHKVAGIEKMLALMANSMTEQDARSGLIETAVLTLAERVQHLMLASDGRVAALEYVSVRELLDEAHALQKGRNSINRKIGRELRDRALLARPPLSVRKCPHSNVWLFPRDFASLYMTERGNTLVLAHNERVMGQGVLKFPRRNSHHKPSSNGEARP